MSEFESNISCWETHVQLWLELDQAVSVDYRPCPSIQEPGMICVIDGRMSDSTAVGGDMLPFSWLLLDLLHADLIHQMPNKRQTC